MSKRRSFGDDGNRSCRFARKCPAHRLRSIAPLNSSSPRVVTGRNDVAISVAVPALPPALESPRSTGGAGDLRDFRSLCSRIDGTGWIRVRFHDCVLRLWADTVNSSTIGVRFARCKNSDRVPAGIHLQFPVHSRQSRTDQPVINCCGVGRPLASIFW